MQTVSDRTLTAANSILLMRVKGFNDSFVQIEGYAADNAFDFGQGKIGETMMGVDGQQSGGFTPYEVDFNIQLAPTSKSRDYFDQFTNDILQRQETRMVEFLVEISAVKKRYYATGFLVEVPGGTSAKKTLESSTYGFRIVVRSEEI